MKNNETIMHHARFSNGNAVHARHSEYPCSHLDRLNKQTHRLINIRTLKRRLVSVFIFSFFVVVIVVVVFFTIEVRM